MVTSSKLDSYLNNHTICEGEIMNNDTSKDMQTKV